MAFTTKWYMADPHFGHGSIREMVASRSIFETVEAMDQAIIDRVNERVLENDLLFILGDFAVSKDAAYVAHCFNALHGRKVLILGNHDMDNKGRINSALSALPWDMPPVAAMETKDGGSRLWLAHYAHRVWPASHYGSYHFFGHSHGALTSYGRSRDIGVDVPDMGFGPRRFAEITEGME